MIQQYPRVRFECGPDFSCFFKGQRQDFFGILIHSWGTIEHHLSKKISVLPAEVTLSAWPIAKHGWLFIVNETYRVPYWSSPHDRKKSKCLVLLRKFKSRPIEHGFSESCMNLSDPNVFPKNCSLGEENETKPELPQLLLLLYVPIILVTSLSN